MQLIGKRRRVTWLCCVGFFMSGCHGAASGAQMSGGTGQVLNTTTNLPVPSADVSLECQRYVNIEGSKTVKVIHVTTDDQGNYAFTDKDVSGCDIGFVRVNKAGYEDASKIAVRYEQRTDYNHIPKVRYLAPITDAVMLRLRQINPRPRETLFYGGRIPSQAEEQAAKPNEPANQEYARVYSAFFESKWIAETPEQKKFVVDHYCNRLEDIYIAMTNAEKAQATNHTVSYEAIASGVGPGHSSGHTLHMAPTDPSTEVTPYCSSEGASKGAFTYQFPANSSCLVISGDPAKIKNANCGFAVHVVLAFNHEGNGVEAADLSPGQEQQLVGTGNPRTAQCPVGQVPVTASGQPWVGIENAAFCRASVE